MRIFVLIPVFNRLVHTQKVIDSLRAQTLRDALQIVVINDGSTDGTAEFLKAQDDVLTIQGDGNLWWSGAIQKGLDAVLRQCKADDYILFLNNDTWFAPDYLAKLVECSRAYNGAAVGSVIHEEGRDPPMVSVGAVLNVNRLAVWDRLSELGADEVRNPQPTYKVDALSGRGTLYPAGLFAKYGGVQAALLPHYLADYELSMRFSRNGTPLLVSSAAIVFSPPVYGNDATNVSVWRRTFGRRSAHNIFQRLIFYSLVGSPLQRVTALPRMVYFGTARALSAWRVSRKVDAGR